MSRGTIIGLTIVGVVVVLYFIYKSSTQAATSSTPSAPIPQVVQTGVASSTVPTPLQTVGSNASPIITPMMKISAMPSLTLLNPSSGLQAV